jgi:hypothetical protein
MTTNLEKNVRRTYLSWAPPGRNEVVRRRHLVQDLVDGPHHTAGTTLARRTRRRRHGSSSTGTAALLPHRRYTPLPGA